MRQSTTKYRVCDRCDYDLSNLGFQKRLKDDIEAKKNVTKVVQENIGLMNGNLQKVNRQIDEIKESNAAAQAEIAELEKKKAEIEVNKEQQSQLKQLKETLAEIQQ